MKLIFISLVFLGISSQAFADAFCYVENNRLIVSSYIDYIATYDLQTGISEDLGNMYGRRLYVLDIFEDLGSPFKVGESMCLPTKGCSYLKSFSDKSLRIIIHDILKDEIFYILTPKVTVGIHN